MANNSGLDFNEAFRSHEFRVEIGDFTSPNITKVTGLNEGEIEAVEQPDGGAHITHKISSGIVKFGDLTLERIMDGSDDDLKFMDWFNEMFKADGTGRGSLQRRSGAVVMSQFGQDVMRFQFDGAWIKSSKFSDLDAAASGIFKQTIVLAVERIIRVKLSGVLKPR